MPTAISLPLLTDSFSNGFSAATIGIAVAVVSADMVLGGSDDSQSNESTMESANEENTFSSEKTTIRLQTKDPSFGYDSSNGQIINSNGTSFRDTTVNAKDVKSVTRINDSPIDDNPASGHVTVSPGGQRNEYQLYITRLYATRNDWSLAE